MVVVCFGDMVVAWVVCPSIVTSVVTSVEIHTIAGNLNVGVILVQVELGSYLTRSFVFQVTVIAT